LGSATAASEAIFGFPGLFNDSTSNPANFGSPPGTFSGLAVEGVVQIVNAGALSGTGVKWQFNKDSNTASIMSNYISGGSGAGSLSTSGSINATSCEGREVYNGPPPNPICNPVSQFGTIEMLAAESSSGPISTNTTLQLSGPGINPPSPYDSNMYLLQWLEVHPIEGLPMGSNGTIIGPFYGCFHESGSGTIGPNC
jgi:hypothetical protein